MVYAALFTYAAEVVPEHRRTEGLALFGAAGLVTLGISSQLGDFLLSFTGYSAVFITATSFCALSLLLTSPLPDVGTRSSPEARASLWSTATQRDLLPIWISAFTFFVGMSGVMTFLKTFVLRTGHGTTGAFFTAYTLSALTLRVFFGALPDRVGPARMVAPALLAYAAGAGLLSGAATSLTVTLAGVLCGVGHGYAFPVFLSLTVSRARPEIRGSATSLFTAVDWAGSVAAPPLLGLVIEGFGYEAAFVALAATLVTGVLTFYALDRVRAMD
jgi:MFS family permease